MSKWKTSSDATCVVGSLFILKYWVATAKNILKIFCEQYFSTAHEHMCVWSNYCWSWGVSLFIRKPLFYSNWWRTIFHSLCSKIFVFVIVFHNSLGCLHFHNVFMKDVFPLYYFSMIYIDFLSPSQFLVQIS